MIPLDGFQILPGLPTGIQETKGRYDGGEDRGPPGCRTDEVILGHKPDMLPEFQVSPTTYHYRGSGENLIHEGSTLQVSPPGVRVDPDHSPVSEYTI